MISDMQKRHDTTRHDTIRQAPMTRSYQNSDGKSLLSRLIRPRARARAVQKQDQLRCTRHDTTQHDPATESSRQGNVSKSMPSWSLDEGRGVLIGWPMAMAMARAMARAMAKAIAMIVSYSTRLLDAMFEDIEDSLERQLALVFEDPIAGIGVGWPRVAHHKCRKRLRKELTQMAHGGVGRTHL
jgi:hypothetical protein